MKNRHPRRIPVWGRVETRGPRSHIHCLSPVKISESQLALFCRPRVSGTKGTAPGMLTVSPRSPVQVPKVIPFDLQLFPGIWNPFYRSTLRQIYPGNYHPSCRAHHKLNNYDYTPPSTNLSSTINSSLHPDLAFHVMPFIFGTL